MSVSPEQTYRMTILITSGVGLALFLAWTGLAGWQLWHKIELHDRALPVTLTVSKVGQLCRVERRADSTWTVEAKLACDEAARLVAARNSPATPWRSEAVAHAWIWYRIGETVYEQAVEPGEISLRPVAAGMELPAYVDVRDRMRIERPYAESDWQSFKLMVAAAAACGAFFTVFGFGFASWSRYLQRRAVGSNRSAASDGKAAAAFAGDRGAAAAAGGGGAASRPAWSIIAASLGKGIFALGLALGLVGLVAGGQAGDLDAIRGGALVAAVALALWRILAYVASFGRR
jgi:hypothetical protein